MMRFFTALTLALPQNRLNRVESAIVPCSIALLRWFFFWGFFVAAARLEAHPAHAKPVKYPFVVGFERFHTDLDTPNHLAKGGLILINELNCVACHAPPTHLVPILTGKPGTRLDGVGSRFEDLDLEMMIRSPRFVKTDTTMPSLFSGPDRDPDEIEALKHFLSTLKEPAPHFPDGDIEKGRLLYHKIGCVSCHAPEIDYRPPWVPTNIEMVLSSLPSVPMNLADRYPREALIDLILDPTKHRPAGRMPRFELSLEEAVDIGSYLNASPKPELSRALQAALAKPTPFHPDPVLIDEGRRLFGAKNCVACHAGVIDDPPLLSKPLEELLYQYSEDPSVQNLQPKGCLSERPAGKGIPAFGLDNLQKRAISLALRNLSAAQIVTPTERIDWAFSTQNCYACHDRHGKGGPESTREIFFTVNDPSALPLGQLATHPPGLDGVGHRLSKDWWQRIVLGDGGSGAVRHHMATRMPVFRSQDLSGLDFGVFRSLDAFPVANLHNGGNATRGHQLIGIDGKNCVACHGLGELEPPEMQSINLNFATRRLAPAFFSALGQPTKEARLGLPMPEHQLSEEQTADLWAYLHQREAFPPPKGLLLPDVTELAPDRFTLTWHGPFGDRSNDALFIGFPGGWNLAFDRASCRWISLWKGRFIDPGTGEGNGPARALSPLGEEVSLPEIWHADEAVFVGHVFNPDLSVTLRYRSGDHQFEDRVSPDGRRVVRKTGQPSPVVVEETLFVK